MPEDTERAVASPEHPDGASNAPITAGLLQSLVDDYHEGRLPPETMARMEEMRDAFYQSSTDRVNELAADAKSNMDDFARDLLAQVREYESTHGAIAGHMTDEYIDSDAVPLALAAVDGTLDVLEPVVDGVADVVDDAFAYARNLIDIRAEHDPDGAFADRIRAAQQEMDVSVDSFDAAMETFHEQVEQAHDAIVDATDRAEAQVERDGVHRLYGEPKALAPEAIEQMEDATDQTTA